MPSRRSPSSEEALSFVAAQGVVLESAHGKVPTFVDFVAGERVTRWWSHPQSKLMFTLTRTMRDSPDVLTCRLIDGKITYVHRRLWPVLVKIAGNFDREALAAVREEHTAGGKHQIVVTEFPKWLPAEVVAESKKLSEREARSLWPAEI